MLTFKRVDRSFTVDLSVIEAVGQEGRGSGEDVVVGERELDVELILASMFLHIHR